MNNFEKSAAVEQAFVNRLRELAQEHLVKKAFIKSAIPGAQVGKLMNRLMPSVQRFVRTGGQSGSNSYNLFNRVAENIPAMHPYSFMGNLQHIASNRNTLPLSRNLLAQDVRNLRATRNVSPLNPNFTSAGPYGSGPHGPFNGPTTALTTTNRDFTRPNALDPSMALTRTNRGFTRNPTTVTVHPSDEIRQTVQRARKSLPAPIQDAEIADTTAGASAPPILGTAAGASSNSWLNTASNKWNNLLQTAGRNPKTTLGTLGGGAYLLDQNGQRRGQNNMAEHYNDMGYFPKLMMALANKQAPTQSFFNPTWAVPGM